MGIPGLLLYLSTFIIGPLRADPGSRNDLDVYLRAAADMAAGRDPYGDFAAVTRQVDPTLTGGYIYPPGLAWCLQPLAHVPRPLSHALVAIVLQLLLLVSLAAILRAVGPVPARLGVLIGLLTMLFFPLWQNLAYQQVNLLLLALSSVWLASWAGGPRREGVGEGVGGLAAGVAVALKLIQAPSLALVLWRRRWSMLWPSLVGVLAVLIAGFPWLGEYATRVLPRVGRGTGWVLNQAPAALTARLLHPVSFYRTTPDTGAEVAVTAAVLGLLVFALTLRVLVHRPADRRQRCLEVAAVVAATPVFLPLSWDTHLVLLLLPLVVLTVDSVRRRHVPGMLAAAFAWLVTGPLHLAYVVLFGQLLRGPNLNMALSTGHPAVMVDMALRVGAELGPVGIVVLWLACLRAYSASYAWST
ncbi:MAG: glycosyltransferase family 87 protein [Candidatus Dormibacteria bacterium]